MHLRLQPLPSITSRPAPQLCVSFPALDRPYSTPLMSDSTNSFNWILSTQLVYSYWIASTFITGFWTAIYLFLFLRQRASPCGTLIHDATCLVLISSCIMLGFLPDPLWKRRYLDFNSPDRPSQTSLTRGRFMFGIVITDL